MTDLDAIAKDLVARRAAHTINLRYRGPSHRRAAQAVCSCGWSAAEATQTLPPQWAQIDTHLLSTLPAWERGTCWCGRVMLLSPFGRWVHAQVDACLGHNARPAPDTADVTAPYLDVTD